MGKKYQNDQCETSVPAVPEQVSVALGELVGEVREGLLALAVGTGLQWAIGNRTLPRGGESPAELRDVDPTIGMFQAHQDEVAKALAARRAALNTEQGESPEVTAGELQARVQGADFGVWFLRDRIRRTGLIPPDLPPELSHIDVNFHPPQLADLSLGSPE